MRPLPGLIALAPIFLMVIFFARGESVQIHPQGTKIFFRLRRQ